MLGLKIAATSALLLVLSCCLGAEAAARGWDRAESIARLGLGASVLGACIGLLVSVWSL